MLNIFMSAVLSNANIINKIEHIPAKIIDIPVPPIIARLETDLVIRTNTTYTSGDTVIEVNTQCSNSREKSSMHPHSLQW